MYLVTHQLLNRIFPRYLAISTCIFSARGRIIGFTRRWGHMYVLSTVFRVFTLPYGHRTPWRSRSLEISIIGNAERIRCTCGTRTWGFGNALCLDCRLVLYTSMRSSHVTITILSRKLIPTVLPRNCVR